MVSVTLRNSQTNPLHDTQIDANWQALADGVNNNAAAIANISASVPTYGPTASRPSSPKLWQPYIDTDLNQPIWASKITPSVIWTNSAGVQV